MNKLRNSIFNKIFAKCEKNYLTKKIMDFTIGIGLGDFVYRTFSKEYLKERQKYFEENKNRIKNNILILEDEESKEIYKKMIDYRCYRKRKDFPKYNTKNVYFPDDIIKLSTEEVFIDCGAYDGDTIKDIHAKTEGKYKKIIAFEPDEGNFAKIQSNIEQKENIEVYKFGVWKEEKTLKFNTGKGLGSKIETDGEIQIKVINLDAVEACKDATYIKMDIEGSELDALKGAEKIIKTNKPKLAICIYHSDNDMIDIIEYIYSIVPEYKMYIRQHSLIESDTVMYCI